LNVGGVVAVAVAVAGQSHALNDYHEWEMEQNPFNKLIMPVK